MRHAPRPPVRLAAGAAVLAVALAACSSSGAQTPTASNTRPHQRPSGTPSATGEPSTPPASTTPPTALTFSPKSGGKHLDECQRLEPGDDPAEFVYYPVLVTPADEVDLDSVGTDHTEGVVEAGSWIAAASANPETGTFKGWPPAFLAQDQNLQWGKRVPAAGATLEPGVTYNVFLRLQVDPTPGDSTVNGLIVSYHDSSGAPASATWKATTTFSMDC